MREVLPNRRAGDSFDFEHGSLKYTATIGYYPDRRVGEIFLNCSKQGTAADNNARDAAIAVSLALQHGVDINVIRHALTRNGDGSPSSAIGKVLDSLAVSA